MSTVVEGRKALWREAGVVPLAPDLYDAAAAAHEDTVSLVLTALSPLIGSFVMTCMMTTYRSLFPSYLDAHSRLLQTRQDGHS